MGEFVEEEDETVVVAAVAAVAATAAAPPAFESTLFAATDGGKETILLVLSPDAADDADSLELCADAPPKPLNADADFFTPGNGVSSTAWTPPPRNPALPASTDVVRDAVEVMGDSGGEA